MTNITAARPQQIQFLEWLGSTHPQVLKAVTTQLAKARPAQALAMAASIKLAKPHLNITVPKTAPAQTTPGFRSGAGLHGLADTAPATTTSSSSGSWWDSIVGAISSALPTYITGKTQLELAQIQLQRAQQGLPPIDTSAIAPTVNVGVSAPTKQLLIYGGIGVAGIALFALLLGSKKRGR